MLNDDAVDAVAPNQLLQNGVPGAHVEAMWRRNQALSTLLSLTTAVSASLDLGEVVKAALDNTVKLFDAAAGDIAVSGLPAETRSVWLRKSNVLDGQIGATAPRLNREFSTRAARDGKPAIIGIDTPGGAGLDGEDPALFRGIVKLAVIPLTARGQVSGVLTLGCGPRSGIEEIDPAMLQSVGLIAGAAIENSRTYLRLKRVSDTDSVTGAYNHRFMTDKLDRELKRAIRYGRPLGLMMLDIDHFKKINDDHGHLFGDLVLRKTALAISSACRETDFVGRYGGDEFIVVLPETGEEDLSVVSRRAYERVHSLRIKAPGSGSQSVSVGIAVGKSVYPLRGHTSRQLIDAADKDLYACKHGGDGSSGRRQIA